MKSESRSVTSNTFQPQGLYSHGILQARILEWVAVPFSRDLPNPGIEPRSPALPERRKQYEKFKSMNLWPQSNGNMSKISYIKLEMKKCQGNSELSILNVESGDSSWMF